jgi:hypothetical protein
MVVPSNFPVSHFCHEAICAMVVLDLSLPTPQRHNHPMTMVVAVSIVVVYHVLGVMAALACAVVGAIMLAH